MSQNKSEKSLEPKAKEDEDEIIGQAYEQPKSITERYAKGQMPVLFVGETGTGKELFAKHYYQSSPRKNKKFNIVNCAGISKTLLESEIFGHEKGAFTGATEKKIGKIEDSQGGILFLDEIGDASEELQAALLRVVEYKSFYRVGGNQEIKVDVIIIAATNKLQALRNELKYRFRILYIPPLQKMDIPLLTKHFLGKSLKKEILEELIVRDYPGNVRELKGVCEKRIVEEGDSIFGEDTLQIPTYEDFDYKRFSKEMETWDEMVQPLIGKYRLTNFRYKYQPLRDIGLGQSHRVSRANQVILWLLGQYVDELDYYVGKQTPEEALNENLTFITIEELIPNLLKKLSSPKPGSVNTLGSKDSNISKPKLEPLLELPSKEASEGFKKLYMEYHLKRSGNNLEEMAKSVGMTEKSLTEKLRRLNNPAQ